MALLYMKKILHIKVTDENYRDVAKFSAGKLHRLRKNDLISGKHLSVSHNLSKPGDWSKIFLSYTPAIILSNSP